MTKQKQKTQQELERAKGRLGLTMIIITIVFFLTLGLVLDGSRNLKGQLSECQDTTINYKDFSINFNKVTTKDKDIFMSYLNDIKNQWFYGIKSIIVYGDKTLFASHSGCVYKQDLMGCNALGNIKIYYNSDVHSNKELKNTICHELAHSHIEGLPRDIEEQIAVDIGNSMSCYI